MKRCILFLPLVACCLGEKVYKPEWKDLDSRPLPAWYDEAKVGIFIHWGVYSVPSYGGEWFWMNWYRNNTNTVNFMKKNYPPGFTYQEFAPQFTAEFFNATQWADLFYKAGAKYVVLTSKHHDGFTLWPSKKSYSWNSVDVGPHRDIVKELSKAVRAKGMKFGLYYSLYEWFNPIYVEDRETNFTSRTFVETKVWPEIQQLVNDYEPSVIWADGDWEAYDPYWNSTGLLAWMYNESPVKNEIVVNDRWGIGSYCTHGDFYNCLDRYNPGVLMDHKWENAFTIEQSWGYRRGATVGDYMSIEKLLWEVVTSVSCGGNVLANIGPTKEGTIIPLYQERLIQLGRWLAINGEAIYGSSPWLHQNDTSNPERVWYTCTKKSYDASKPTAKPNPEDVTAVYAIVLEWPTDNQLTAEDITEHLVESQSTISMLGNDGNLSWTRKHGVTTIRLPDLATVKSKWAYVLKILL